MKLSNQIAILIALILGSTVSASSSATQESTALLSPFSTDGCSMFLDGWFKKVDKDSCTSGNCKTDYALETTWNHCCIAHDINYWMGGAQQEKLDSDERLRSCVENSVVKKYGDGSKKWARRLGREMKRAVGFGGAPGTLFPWRWGYGWSEFPDYKVLSQNQNLQAYSKLLDLFLKLKSTPQPFLDTGIEITNEQRSYLIDVTDVELKLIEGTSL